MVVVVEEEEGQEEEETVLIGDLITNEDPPKAHQAQHRPKPRFDECVASVHAQPTAVL